MTTAILYSKLNYDSNYKLIQLTPEIFGALNAKKTLEFKATDPEQPVVLCSEDTTWILKQKNHSNTVLLMKEVGSHINSSTPNALIDKAQLCTHHLGFTKLDSELEPRLTEGQINFTSLPIYNGDKSEFLNNTKDRSLTYWSLENVKRCSPCSEREFNNKWHSIGGCVINGYACLLSHDFISRTLHIMLMSCMAENLALDEMEIDRTFEAVKKDIDDTDSNITFTKEMIATVIGKFCTPCGSTTWKLDEKLVSVWYGIIALKKFASSRMISEDEFMIKWKSQFPPYFSCNLDFSVLRGHFYRPLGSGVQYLSVSTLPNDVRDRFKHLFKLQSTWELEEIEPYIKGLNIKGLKIDSFVMKYARRRKQGKRTLVSSR